MSTTVNPKPFLKTMTGKEIIVKLKWGMEYRGILSKCDDYMNLKLTSTDEYVDGSLSETLGDVLIRCNNILYVRENIASDEDK